MNNPHASFWLKLAVLNADALRSCLIVAMEVDEAGGDRVSAVALVVVVMLVAIVVMMS